MPLLVYNLRLRNPNWGCTAVKMHRRRDAQVVRSNLNLMKVLAFSGPYRNPQNPSFQATHLPRAFSNLLYELHYTHLMALAHLVGISGRWAVYVCCYGQML